MLSWGNLATKTSFSCFLSMTLRLLFFFFCLQQQRYLSQCNSSYTHFLFRGSILLCVCAKRGECVWSQDKLDQGKFRLRAFSHSLFFQADQIPNLVHDPAAHTAITAKVQRGNCLILALQIHCCKEKKKGCLLVILLATFCCPSPYYFTDNYQQNPLSMQTMCLYFLKLRNSLVTTIMQIPLLC